MGENRVKMT